MLRDAVRPVWLQQQQQQHSNHFFNAARCCSARAGGHVLELGCGTGASSRWMARHGFRVTAVDISAAALQAAAAAASAEGLPADNPQLLCQDIFELDAQQAPGFAFIYDCQGGCWASQQAATSSCHALSSAPPAVKPTHPGRLSTLCSTPDHLTR